jgi:hypothetical protein
LSKPKLIKSCRAEEEEEEEEDVASMEAQKQISLLERYQEFEFQRLFTDAF